MILSERNRKGERVKEQAEHDGDHEEIVPISMRRDDYIGQDKTKTKTSQYKNVKM